MNAENKKMGPKKKQALITLFGAFIILIPLGLIGYGAYLIHPPAAFIAVGSLIWIDLNIKNKSKDKK